VGNLKGKGGELPILLATPSRRSSGPPSVVSTGFAARPTCPIRFYVTPDSACGSNRHPIRQTLLNLEEGVGAVSPIGGVGLDLSIRTCQTPL
jgi:hypothetical protein